MYFEINIKYKVESIIKIEFIWCNDANKIYDLYRSVNLLGIIIIIQVFLGVFTILYGAQILIASMHQISSIFLVSSCIYFIYVNTKFN